MYSAAEELDRKVSETLVDIIKKQTGGLMTTNEAKAAIHSVFCSVMGLVGVDVAELLEEAIEKERPSPFPLYMKTANGAYITVSPDTSARKVTVKLWRASTAQWIMSATARPERLKRHWKWHSCLPNRARNDYDSCNRYRYRDNRS